MFCLSLLFRIITDKNSLGKKWKAEIDLIRANIIQMIVTKLCLFITIYLTYQCPIKVILLLICPIAKTSIKCTVTRTLIRCFEHHVINSNETTIATTQLCWFPGDAFQVDLE